MDAQKPAYAGVVKASARRPTINDVARVAGVSRGTVSRVLNGGRWVSPRALAAVDAAIAQTGYQVNTHARGLVTARAGSVAFLLTETQDRLFDDPNFAVLMGGAAQALEQHDISLVLLLAGTATERQRAARFIARGHVDGVLLVSSHADTSGLLDELIAAHTPIISCGVPLRYERKIGYVSADDVAGAVDAVGYLQSVGRQRIAMIAGPQDTSGGTRRLQGYREQLADSFDLSLVAFGDYSKASGAQAMSELLERAPDIDAVFTANDLMASAALEVIASTGRRVPDDIAVVGFDDSRQAQLTKPALTTMRQPFDRISQEMVRLLLDVVNGQRPASMLLPTELVIRHSA